MKVEEIKIGMEVFICRRLLKPYYSSAVLSKMENGFPGIIVGQYPNTFYQENPVVQVRFKSGNSFNLYSREIFPLH